MPKFELQPEKSELSQLAEDNWAALGDSDKKIEENAFSAGQKLLSGSNTPQLLREYLEAIVRWKSPRVLPHIKKNPDHEIAQALDVVCDVNTPAEMALEALIKLRGVGIPVASAILTAIYPDRYTVIDFRALEALGYDPVDVSFYLSYLKYCQELAKSSSVREQKSYPAPTPLRALDRALWQWSADRASETKSKN